MKKKNLLALLLALMMASSTATAFTACGDDNDTSSSSSSSSSSVDADIEELTILNSDFETYDNHDGAYPMVTDVDGWTWSRNTASTGTAIESKSESGIVDTDPEAWKQFTTSGLPTGKTIDYLVDHVNEAEDLWDTLTAKDKVEFYDAWEKKNPKKEIEDELDFYESLNIDKDDLMVFNNNAGETWATIENPGTHFATDADLSNEYDKTHTKVLMLRNNHSSTSGDFIGTAAKYTSTTNVTVDAGTVAEFSVWVKTANLRDQRNDRVVDKGAYIQITHALGSKTQEPLLVKNINTEGVTENNGWVQYSFALKGSPFTSSSFTIVLGLGMTGGTNRLEYVNGVAFFDDIQCTTKTLEGYTDVAGSTKVTLGDENKEYPQNEAEAFHYTLDFTDTLTTWNVLSQIPANNVAPTTEKGTDQTYSSVVGKNPYPTLNGGFSQEGDITLVNTTATEALQNGAKANAFSKAAYSANFLTENENGDKVADRYSDMPALVLFSANGAAYTAKTNDFSVNANERVLYSFFVKTSEMNGLTGATVKLVDNEGNPALSLDSTSAMKIEIDETDIHDGWVQCFFFIHNDSGVEIKNLHFEFSYGPTTIINTAKTAYQAGFAVFTNFQTKSMSDKEFECAVSGAHAKVVTLSGKVNEFTGDNGFATPTLSETMDIEDGYALPKEYAGKLIGETTKTNYAGLLDEEHKANYATLLDRLAGKPGATWEDVFGDPVYHATATRPLVIETVAGTSYGYIGDVASVSANTLKTVSLRVKVSGDAVANVYLVDTTDKEFDVLTVERGITYWYDAQGNVLSKDPADDDFYARKHTAFKKQSNGLYKVNPTWEYASSVDPNKYYANLQAYERDAKTGNLLLDSKTTYAYNDAWKHDGNDGYAFYNANETKTEANVYSNKDVKVYDFSTVTDLTPRYQAKTSNGLSATITNTDGAWVEVVFYLRAGSTAKSYRLEVWNGSRTEASTATNGFVAFDSWSVGNDETSFDEWLTSAKEGKEEGNDYFESVFSFYDHAQYLRYDEDIDQNKVKDAFKLYTYATDGEGVAYLTKQTDSSIRTYANFSFAETIQTPDPIEDEKDDSSNDNVTENENETNPWLLASSIVIAAALLFAVASLIVRRIVADVRKKRGIVVQPKVKKKSNND